MCKIFFSVLNVKFLELSDLFFYGKKLVKCVVWVCDGNFVYVIF